MLDLVLNPLNVHHIFWLLTFSRELPKGLMKSITVFVQEICGKKGLSTEYQIWNIIEKKGICPTAVIFPWVSNLHFLQWNLMAFSKKKDVEYNTQDLVKVNLSLKRKADFKALRSWKINSVVVTEEQAIMFEWNRLKRHSFLPLAFSYHSSYVAVPVFISEHHKPLFWIIQCPVT